MKIILITPETGDLELEALSSFFDQGLEYLHVRKPFFSEVELKEYLSRISPAYYDRIILHSFYHLVPELNLLGIHLTEKGRSMGVPDNFRGQVSASFHSLEELKNNNIRYNYAFLSPVFNSISKHGYKSAFTKADLIAALKGISQEVIALGGIDLDNLNEVKEMGFSGIALLGAVWTDENPLQKFVQIKEAFQILK